MFDPLLRRLIDPALDRAAGFLVKAGAGANSLTIAGFLIGCVALPMLAIEAYGWALAAIIANRLCDGLDGAVARRIGPTDFGGYLDIVCDMLFYALCALGFALARPENTLAAAVLLASFVGTASSFLAWAVLASARNLHTTARGRKSFYHAGGLIEGSETVAFLIVACVFPSAFSIIAAVFALLCLVTIGGRIWMAYRATGLADPADARAG